MTAKTSDRVSSIAGKYATITPDQILVESSSETWRITFARDVRSMAASLLKQDEHRGLRGLWRKMVG